MVRVFWRRAVRATLLVVAASAPFLTVPAGAQGQGPPPPGTGGGPGWSIAPSPNVNVNDNGLGDVTCIDSADCWAVGLYTSDAQNFIGQTLIEHFDGASWSIVTSPNTSASQANNLSGVACLGAGDCWAVGFAEPGGSGPAFTTLIEHYDGKAWSISPSPGGGPFAGLQDVFCVAAADCWTVGGTLVEHYDGATWSIVASPSAPAGTVNFLNGVSCTSTTDCWAAGSFGDDCQCGGPAFQTLIEHFDGSTWSLAKSPNPTSSDNVFLTDITCTTGAGCWAVGDHGPGGSSDRTLIEHFDGTAWTIVNSPNTNSTDANDLGNVACAAAADCWAVGDVTPGVQNPTVTLTEHFDGSAWSIVSSPSVNGKNSRISGVSCANGNDCWAAGSFGGSCPACITAPQQTLVEQFTALAGTAPVFTADAPPSTAVQGVSYTYTFTATGVPAPVFALAGGTLPPGLSLDSASGLLAGAPTATGVFTFAVRAGNGVTPDAVSPSISITVNPPPAPPTFTADAPPRSAVQGIAYAYAFAAAGNPAPSFSLASGTLPPGLSLEAATGALAGVPAAAGTFTFTVRAANGIGPDAVTPAITIAVAPPNADLSMSLTAPTAAEHQTSITYQLTVTNNGPSPAAGDQVSLALPRGTSLIAATVGAAIDRRHRAVGWSVASLDAGGRLEFTVTVSADKPGTLTAMAAVRSLTLDLNPQNNAASAVTLVYRGHPHSADG
jgi:uncharacterized repeat protein (TIGR01451 family)